MIKESLRRNHENFLLDYETSLIIDCVSPFAYAFDKFKGQKSFDEFIQKQKFYVAPKQVNIGFDEVFQKEDYSVCSITFNFRCNTTTCGCSK